MDNKQNKSNFRFIWSLVMIVFYVGFAYVIVFTPLFATVDQKIRIAMGIVLTIYGLFRGFRLWKIGK